MSWLSEYVIDPVKTLIADAKSVPALAAIAGDAEKAYAAAGPSGVASDVVTGLETALQAAVDAAITGVVGSAGPIGAALAPTAVSAANTGLTWLEQHAVSVVSGLFAAGRANVAKAAPPSAAS